MVFRLKDWYQNRARFRGKKNSIQQGTDKGSVECIALKQNVRITIQQTNEMKQTNETNEMKNEFLALAESCEGDKILQFS